MITGTYIRGWDISDSRKKRLRPGSLLYIREGQLGKRGTAEGEEALYCKVPWSMVSGGRRNQYTGAIDDSLGGYEVQNQGKMKRGRATRVRGWQLIELKGVLCGGFGGFVRS